MSLGLDEVAARVRDDAEHVEHVRETVGLRDDLLQQVLRFVELALLVMLASEQEQLLDVIIHGPSFPGAACEPFAPNRCDHGRSS